ncbi:MAG: PASTA domain-containing protein [Micromonosporaceae bacterium]
MNVSQGTTRLIRLAVIAAQAISLAGTVAGSPPAQASTIAPVITGHAAAGWGYNGFGELGDGQRRKGCCSPRSAGWAATSSRLRPGQSQSLAVTSGGTVWAWGSNLYGQLGNGTTIDTSNVPVQVKGLTGVVAVAAGYEHSLALRDDGTVWAWGGNPEGQLGTGATGNTQLTPVEVAGLTGVTKIAAGGFFSLALRSDGTVWAWGSNATGELGDGTTTSSPVPVRVTGLSQVTGIAAGYSAAYAIRTRSITALASLWAWGDNTGGGLGDGTQTNHLTPEEVTGISAPSIASVAAGREFAVARGSDGSVWAWGDNSGGQLGTAPAANPVLRPVETIGTGSGIIQLSANSIALADLKFAHVAALRSDGTVLAWGYNSQGELGDGTTAAHFGPEQVAGLTGATQVSAGANFTLAVTALATVPDVRRLTTTAASSTLQAAGFVLGQVTTAADNACDHFGVIMWQSPAVGTSARLGSPVRVTIGVPPPTPCP